MRVRSLIVLSVVALIVPAIMGTGPSMADEDCGVGTTGILSVDNALAATLPCAKVTVTSPIKQVQGSTFDFDASDSVGGDGDPIISFEWDWDGDGTFEDSTGTTATASHVYATPGVYTVKMRVTSGSSPSDTASKVASVTIVVWPDPNNPPVASFTTTPPAQIGVPQTFDASASHDDDPDGSITKYEWDWNNDGTVDDTTAAPTIQHTFAAAGNVTVGLTVTDERAAPDTRTGSTTRVVNVTRPPVANFTATPNSVNPGGTVQFDGSTSYDPDGDGIALYEWDFDGNGTYDAAGTSPTISHPYPTIGTFAARLRVTDGLGVTGTKSLPVVVTNAVPVARLTVTPNPVTAGDSVLLDGSASSDPDGSVVRYDWDLDGNGTYETTTNGSPTIAWAYPNAATVNVGLRVRDNDGATGVTHATLKVDAPAAGGGSTGGGSTGGGSTGGGSTGGGSTGGGSTAAAPPAAAPPAAARPAAAPPAAARPGTRSPRPSAATRSRSPRWC